MMEYKDAFCRILDFFVQGKPEPQARPRAFTNKAKNGKTFSKVVSPTTEWKETVKFHANKQRKKHGTFKKALKVSITFTFMRPKSHFGTGRNAGILKNSAPKWHTIRPDHENLSKAVLDAMVDVGLLSDDSIVCVCHVEKIYTMWKSSQGAKIIIEELAG
jgi:Holliday junction resolvase RusA-like endonuclease